MIFLGSTWQEGNFQFSCAAGGAKKVTGCVQGAEVVPVGSQRVLGGVAMKCEQKGDKITFGAA